MKVRAIHRLDLEGCTTSTSWDEPLESCRRQNERDASGPIRVGRDVDRQIPSFKVERAEPNHQASCCGKAANPESYAIPEGGGAAGTIPRLAPTKVGNPFVLSAQSRSLIAVEATVGVIPGVALAVGARLAVALGLTDAGAGATIGRRMPHPTRSVIANTRGTRCFTRRMLPRAGRPRAGGAGCLGGGTSSIGSGVVGATATAAVAERRRPSREGLRIACTPIPTRTG